MNRLLISAAAIAVCGALAALAASHWNYAAESRETFSRTLKAAKTLNVDNVNGFVEVTGDGGNNIRVEGEKNIRALDQTQLDRAKREVTLDVNEKDGVLQLYVNGPFRQHGAPWDYHGFHVLPDREYEVTYNFTIHVPRQTELVLRTVNGALRAGDTTGRFELSDVNGGITMTNVAGSGSAKTVNGSANISFRENPKAATQFQSVNGRLTVAFQPDLAADIHYRTVNGAVFTDFETTVLGAAVTAEPSHGGFVFRQNHGGNVRVGVGGPELDFDTVNGSIEIHKQAR